MPVAPVSDTARRNGWKTPVAGFTERRHPLRDSTWVAVTADVV